MTISVVAAYLSEGCCVANSDVYGGAKQGCGGEKLGAAQRWAKGPIDRSSDTDSIFRLYRTIQSVDVPIFVSADCIGSF